MDLVLFCSLFQGYFGHSEVFRVILVIFGFRRVFWSLWYFQGYFGYIGIFGVILVILVFSVYFGHFDISGVF